MRRLLVKTAFVGLLTMSVALKLFAGPAASQTAPQAIPEGVHQYLAQQGFALSEKPSLLGDALVAARGDCHIEIANVSPLGWHRSVMAELAAGQRLVYLYGGSVYDEQPLTLTKLGHYWSRVTQYIWPSPEPMVRATTISSQCPNDATSLDALAVLSK